MRTGDVEYESSSGRVDPPSDLQPPLAEDLACDVAVVGGGLGGMSTALRLAERGQDVVLLEAEFCVGGMREIVGGVLNPGKFSLGVRRGLLASSARVFEQTKVLDVVPENAEAPALRRRPSWCSP